MSEPHDITQEVWCIAECKEGGPNEPGPRSNVVLAVDQGPNNEPTNVRTIFRSVPEDPTDNTTEMARVNMAARAPTFYRLLEQVVMLGSAPADLELIIKLNLYRAAPKVYPRPEVPNPPRKSAWQKLLDDDLG